MTSRQRKEIAEMENLAEKHLACTAATLSKSLDDITQAQHTLKSFARIMEKKQKELNPLIDMVKMDFYNVYNDDMRAYKELCTHLKSTAVKNLDEVVKKQVKSIKKETFKKFPNLFDDATVKRDYASTLGLI